MVIVSRCSFLSKGVELQYRVQLWGNECPGPLSPQVAPTSDQISFLFAFCFFVCSLVFSGRSDIWMKFTSKCFRGIGIQKAHSIPHSFSLFVTETRQCKLASSHLCFCFKYFSLTFYYILTHEYIWMKHEFKTRIAIVNYA